MEPQAQKTRSNVHIMRIVGIFVMRLRPAVLKVFCSCILQVVCGFSAVGQGAGTVSGDDSQFNVPGVKKFHHGGIRDIEAIGYRNVGCNRGFGNWYSLEQQIKMGKDYADEVDTMSKLITDPIVTEYVNRLGQELVRNSDARVPFTFKIIDSDNVNAFALPGGFFYVDSGLILTADSEAELAGVMAHEIAHVAACHAVRSRTRGQLMDFASLPLMMVGGPFAFAAHEALSVGSPMMFMKFSRQFESEADFLAVQYTYKAGYDPQALTAFFERISGLEKPKQNFVAKAFRNHPQTRDRIKKAQQEINSLLPPRPEYKVDTSEFEEIKMRLSQAETRLGVDEHGNVVPTLKRGPSSVPSDAN
jgi:predicted Zn-dependent protease